MKILHVSVETDDGWLIAQGLEEPGVITQAKSLDELLANVRDAALLLLDAKELHIELIVPPSVQKNSAGPKRRVGSMGKRNWKKGGARVS